MLHKTDGSLYLFQSLHKYPVGYFVLFPKKSVQVVSAKIWIKIKSLLQTFLPPAMIRDL